MKIPEFDDLLSTVAVEAAPSCAWSLLTEPLPEGGVATAALRPTADGDCLLVAGTSRTTDDGGTSSAHLRWLNSRGLDRVPPVRLRSGVPYSPVGLRLCDLGSGHAVVAANRDRGCVIWEVDGARNATVVAMPPIFASVLESTEDGGWVIAGERTNEAGTTRVARISADGSITAYARLASSPLLLQPMEDDTCVVFEETPRGARLRRLDSRLRLVRRATRRFGADGNVRISSISRAGDGGCFLSGSAIETGVRRAFVSKIGRDLSEVWSRTYDLGGYAEGCSCRPTADGGYLLAGYGYANASLVGFLAKLTARGTVVWARSYRPHGTFLANGFAEVHSTPDGGCILLGFSGPTAEASRPWVVKTAADGSVSKTVAIEVDSLDGRDWR